MIWVCPYDHCKLIQEPELLRCSQCLRGYQTKDHAVIFKKEPAQVNPVVEELWLRMADQSAIEVLTEFADEKNCQFALTKSNRFFFIPVPEQGVIVEFGANFAESSNLQKQRDIVLFGKNHYAMRLVGKTLLEGGYKNLHIGSLDSMMDIPLIQNSVAAIIIDERALSEFCVSKKNWPLIAKEFKRIMKPHGSLFLGVPNAIPGIQTFHEKISQKQPRIEEILQPGTFRIPEAEYLVSLVEKNGFDLRQTFAPLPNAGKPDFVLPLGNPQAVRYFLQNLVRKNSMAIRMALVGAEFFLKINLFQKIVPYRYFIFEVHDRESD